ncbi:MAG: SRPBCC family protein [Paludibacter sp.]
MKTLKIIGIGFAVLISLVLIIAIFVPKEFVYEKTIVINAPVDSVWSNTATLSAMDKWSPWNDHDPNMKKEMSGIDGTVGAKQSWDGAIVGVGSQTITKIQKPTLFETSLDFMKPHESHGKGYVKLVANGNTTKTTWGMSGSMPYPFNIMILFMNMEKSMGKDWDLGLSRLKKLSEK